jgi:hypothetical protein
MKAGIASAILFGLAGLAMAAAGARPYAGGWNDGSRLATVEALVDQHTLAIDQTIFVAVPANSPYGDNEALRRQGTMDKLFINGQFFSDKPPVFSILMAGCYRALQLLGMPAAAQRPDLFCRAITIATSGVAFAAAVLCMHGLGGALGLSGPIKIAWTLSFALSTVAVTYTRHVNCHIVCLAVSAGILLLLAPPRLHSKIESPRLKLTALGTLAGFGYCLDLGVGPILLGCLLPLLAYRFRSARALALVIGAAAPWVAAHHLCNYAIGGVWRPMNAVAEYVAWPGSPFHKDNLTGFWHHGPLKLVVYALALLFGKHGFIGHNLPLFLALAAVPLWWKGRVRERPELLFSVTSCVLTWLCFATFSNNYGGACCSVRWFVPFLAPGYFVIAILLRECPVYRGDFLLLSAWGVCLSAVMWWHGPWITRMVPWFWQIQAMALTSWAAYGYLRTRRKRQPLNRSTKETAPLSTAA